MKKPFKNVVLVLVVVLLAFSITACADKPDKPSISEDPPAPYSNLEKTPLVRLWLQKMPLYQQLWAEEDYDECFIGRIERYYVSYFINTLGDIFYDAIDNLAINLPQGIEYLLQDIEYLYNFFGSFAFEYLGEEMDLVLDILNSYTLMDVGFGRFEVIEGTNFVVSNLFSLDRIFEDDIKLIGGNYYTKDGSTLIRWMDKKTKNVLLSEEVQVIGAHAFSCCSAETIAWQGDIKAIGNYAFYNCKSLAQFQLPSDIKEISDSMFKNCKALESITVPASVKYMGSTAFSGSGIADIVFEEGAKLGYIGLAAFRSCENLAEIILPESVYHLSPSVFLECPALERVTLPTTLTTIPYQLFACCSALKEFVISENVEVIEDSAFKDTGLQNISIPKSVKSIKGKAFYACKSLEEVNFDKQSLLENVGKEAFANCKNLSKVINLPDAAVVDSTAFAGSANLTFC